MSRKGAPKTSSNMSGEDIVVWAKAMGFPGADSPEFKANSGRLVTPQLKTMWRHLMKHVRPANEVAHIRRQLLAYKLGVESNSSVNPLKNFDSVVDYEAFLKTSALEAKMKHCDLQAEKKQEEVKMLSTKLEHKGEQHQSQKLEEKEKLEKLRLLRAKREELEQKVVTFKKLVPLLDSFKQPNYSYQNPRTLDSWGLEVQRYCASLVRGQEISLMCEHLGEALKSSSAMKIKAGTCNGDEDSMFHNAITEYHAELGLKVMKLKDNYSSKLEQLEAKKQNMISTMMSSGDVFQIARAGVLKEFLENGRLEEIGKAAERNFQIQWITNNRTQFDNSLNTSYFEKRGHIAELDRMIARDQDAISTFVSFPTTELRSTLGAMVSKMKAEAAATCFTGETPGTAIDKILSDLPQLIELFKKTPLTDKKVDLGTQSLQAYTELKSTLSKTNNARALASLDVSVKERISESTGSTMMKQVSDKVSREKSKMLDMLNNLTGILHEIDENLLYIDGHLACWEKGSPTEVIYNNPDYQDLLKRLKNAMQEK